MSGGTFAAISLAATVGSTILSTVSQSRQAAAASQTANYNMQVAKNQQGIAEQNAAYAERQGAADASRKELQTASLIGSQRAAIAGMGGDPNSGSFLDIVGDTASAGKTDALGIRSNAALKAYGFRAQAMNAAAQAGLYGFQAENATASLPFAMGSTLLSGLSSAATKGGALAKYL